MQLLNKNGVSITQTPGEEHPVRCHFIHLLIFLIAEFNLQMQQNSD